MKIVLLSPSNYCGIPAELARQLNGIDGVNATCLSVSRPVLDPDGVDLVVAEASEEQMESAMSRVRNADVVHVFDFALPDGNVVFGEFMNGQNTIVTYTGDMLSNLADPIVAHVQKARFTVTTIGTGLFQRRAPLTAIPMLPPFKSGLTRQAESHAAGGRRVVTVFSLGGDRHALPELLPQLWKLQRSLPLSVHWIENVATPGVRRALSETSVLIDTMSTSGPSPIALTAMSMGIPVISPLSDLDRVIYDWPCESCRPEDAVAVTGRLLQDADQYADAVRRSVEWANSDASPDRVLLKWLHLYRHVVGQR